MPDRYPSNRLTVIVRDIGDFVNCGEPVQHRSVAITLTDEQVRKLRLRQWEAISQCFIEPSEEEIAEAPDA